ncbi:MAG: hypothetical protein ABI333_27975 [bacterium]
MIRASLGCALAVGVLCVAACGPSAASDQDGAAGSDGTASGHDGGGPGPDGGSPGVDGSVSNPDGGGVTRSYCYQRCNSVADCGTGSAAFDVDNYSCSSNLCIWQGCNNSAECADMMMDASYVCGSLPALPTPSCYKACNTVADCDLGTSLYSADNFQCTTGLCEFTGCNSSAECADTIMDSSYLCGSLPLLPTPQCYKGCSTVSDCVMTNTLYDADNYQCTTGLCEWIGCNSTSECVDAYQDVNLECNE